jgi:YhcG PDDEXK nuclease domain
LELGKGFAFVARQKRITFEDQDFFVDLVFYNIILKCYLLVDLKLGKLTHQDVGQMDSYVRLFDAQGRTPSDGPTIGLILCAEKNEVAARRAPSVLAVASGAGVQGCAGRGSSMTPRAINEVGPTSLAAWRIRHD